jgi:ethanolamine utilization protein EutA
LPGEETDHNHDDMDGLIVPGEKPELELTSIGIDVGSSGTQVAISRLMLERHGEGNTAALSATRREILYQSPILLTPFVDSERIDDAALWRFVRQAMSAARVDPDDIDCGVVLLTGAARERINAEAITNRLAEACGDLVSAAAGHHLEARLAAHGSGAAALSAKHGTRLLNVDIGGATTKLAIADAGAITATHSLAIGGRIAVVDREWRLTRLDPSAARHAAAVGLHWEPGAIILAADFDRVAQHMADTLMDVLAGRTDPEAVEGLLLTPPWEMLGRIDGVVMSGGVAEYVYGRETRDFFDFGKRLGRAIADRIARGLMPWPLMPAGERIRATVLGASAYSVETSGRTSFISDPATLLPRRNLHVVKIAYAESGEVDARTLATAIRAALVAHDLTDKEDEVAFALSWRGAPEHNRLSAFAKGIAQGLAARIARGQSLMLLVDGDVARSLAALLREEQNVAGPLLVLDGIAVSDLDTIDIGRLRMPSETVPVTVKSLVFREPLGGSKAKGRR